VIHVEEDGAWYVLEGSMTFHCGERVIEAVRQTWVFAPRGVVHTFKVGADGTHALAFSFPWSFADFVAAAGEPAPELTIPPPRARRQAATGGGSSPVRDRDRWSSARMKGRVIGRIRPAMLFALVWSIRTEAKEKLSKRTGTFPLEVRLRTRQARLSMFPESSASYEAGMAVQPDQVCPSRSALLSPSTAAIPAFPLTAAGHSAVLA
jgi:hypothetical protein